MVSRSTKDVRGKERIQNDRRTLKTETEGERQKEVISLAGQTVAKNTQRNKKQTSVDLFTICINMAMKPRFHAGGHGHLPSQSSSVRPLK